MAEFTGTSGSDVIEDSGNDDRVFALDGDDIIINRGGSDYFDGGEGQDTLRTDLTGLEGATLNFDTVSGLHGRYQSDVGQDTIVSIENLTVIGDWDVRATGGDEDNVFRLSSGDDVVEAGGGNDVIYEGGGDDIISAGAGDDLIYNLGGSDVFDGGPGTDTIYTDLSPSVLRNLGLEPFSFEIKLDLVAGFHGRPSGTIGADVVQGIENYTLDGEFNSQLLGDNNGNVFIGGGGSDLLEGRGGDDQLSGGDGTDTARYTNARSEYVVTTEAGPEGQTLYRVTSLNQSETGEGSDTLFADIELLEFAGEVMTIEEALGSKNDSGNSSGSENDPSDSSDSENTSTNLSDMTTVLLSEDFNYVIANSDVKVRGAGGYEGVIINAGVSGILLDGSIEAVDLSSSSADTLFQVDETTGRLEFVNDGTVVASFDSGLNRAVNLEFSDGNVTLEQTGANAFSLTSPDDAESTVTVDITTSQTGDAVLFNQVFVESAGESSAASSDVTYDFQSGNYEYEISGFSTGDVLDVSDLDSQFLAVVDADQTDGVQAFELPISSNQTVTITLTGLTGEQDVGVFNSASFTDTFGAGSLII